VKRKPRTDTTYMMTSVTYTLSHVNIASIPTQSGQTRPGTGGEASHLDIWLGRGWWPHPLFQRHYPPRHTRTDTMSPPLSSPGSRAGPQFASGAGRGHNPVETRPGTGGEVSPLGNCLGRGSRPRPLFQRCSRVATRLATPVPSRSHPAKQSGTSPRAPVGDAIRSKKVLGGG